MLPFCFELSDYLWKYNIMREARHPKTPEKSYFYISKNTRNRISRKMEILFALTVKPLKLASQIKLITTMPYQVVHYHASTTLLPAHRAQ